MTSIRWCAVALALGSAAAGWGQSQFWGELKAGKYAVGFRALVQLDVARSYDADYPATGSPPVKKPRPLPTRSAPTSAALVKIPPPTRMKRAAREPPKPNPIRIS